MKVLVFFTIHRQLREVGYQASFFNYNSNKLNNLDVLFHCNNKHMNYNDLIYNINLFNYKTNYIFNNINSGKAYGLIDAIYENWDYLKKYDYVIHAHPDIFFINPSFLDYLGKEDYYLANVESSKNNTAYCSDFFIFKPKDKEIFNKNTLSVLPDIPERYLFEKLSKYDNKKIIFRSNINFGNDKIDEIGLWHEHNLD